MSSPTTRSGKHPKALYVLFLTEMWERFAYYLIAGILFLYLFDSRLKGGKGMDASTAADVTGSFIALIWLPPFIGGLIADRYLGYIKSIFIGGALLAAGYLGLTLPGDTAMYVSLGLIIVGNGFFKPNISTIPSTMPHIACVISCPLVECRFRFARQRSKARVQTKGRYHGSARSVPRASGGLRTSAWPGSRTHAQRDECRTHDS